MTIRELLVKINGDYKGLDKAIGQADAVLGKFGISVKGITNMLSGPAGLAIAAGIAAKAVWDIGIKFDGAYAKISKATGATGKDLEKLSYVFRNTMASGIEQPIDEAADAFGELVTRFNLSGGDLKAATKYFSDFADVTNQQMGPAVRDVSQLMRNWGMETKALPGVLDLLYTASAKTGQSISELSQAMTTGGGILRQAGYSFKDAAALISTFYTAGIDSGRMLMGLNAALAKFAREGKDTKAGIAETFQAIKDAKSSTEATALAVEVFGTRAGPQLADAIRKGSVSIEEMTKALAESDGKVSAVAESSQELSDAWQEFTNAASAAGSRAGEYWMTLAKIGLEIVTPMMEHLARFGEIYFGRFVTSAQNVWKKIKPVFDIIVDYLGGVVDFIGGVISGNWKLAFNGLARSALSVVKFIVSGVEGMVVGVVRGINWLIDKINAGAKALHLPIAEIPKITEKTLGWSTAIDGLIKKLEDNRDALAGLNEETFNYKGTIDDTTEATEGAGEAVGEFGYELENGEEKNHQYSASLQKMLDQVVPIEDKSTRAKKALAEFRKKVQEISATVVSFIGPLVDLGVALGADAEDLAAFGAIATDAINGIAAAISGNIIGAVIAAIGLVTKLINLFKKKSEAAREAKRSTESYMDTVTSGEGKLVRFVNVIGSMFSGLVANFKMSFDKASLEALRTLTAFKELAASYGDSIGKTLGDAMIKGMSKVNFMAEIGKILINAMIAAALATGPIAAAMAAIGEKIAYMVVNGFTDEGMAEVEQMASDLYDIFSTGVLPIVQKIRDIFGQDSASEETGSFASGVTNFRGGIARVGEQGPETVRLPRGASVEPNGMGRSGGITMTFNSPRALSPMETKRAMLAAGRQLAFETGGNF